MCACLLKWMAGACVCALTIKLCRASMSMKLQWSPIAGAVAYELLMSSKPPDALEQIAAANVI